MSNNAAARIILIPPKPTHQIQSFCSLYYITTLDSIFFKQKGWSIADSNR
ncbi:MAG: hypothetical protein QE274_02425 [Verrucomicrobiaceae bacterium]|nr:hypothetical protein [Verrucomicrobiaceae bacterium]